MRGNPPEMRVIHGHGADTERGERIALSLVHPRERIDVPVSAIVTIEATGESTYAEEGTGRLCTFRSPRVELCFTQAIVERICRLSREIGEEPVEIIVGGECVAKPTIFGPLTGPCFVISTYDLAEAHALAHRLRTGWSKAGPRPIS
jgi:hypothetical protein